MGTNYYIRADECKLCHRGSEKIHLGKSSWGWQFSFQYNGGEYYKDVKEMKLWLKGKQIWNEYDDKISHKEFWELVKEKKAGLNHAKRYPSETEQVIDGYSFSDIEFC